MHHDVSAYLRCEGFSVQIGEDNTFGRIAEDQTCEETVNKGTQTPGGTKGFSRKPGAVSKYYLIVEYRSTFMRQLKHVLGLDASTISRIVRDESDVKAVISMLDDSCTNPFLGEQQELVCLSTGKLATPQIEKDLLQAEAHEEKSLAKRDLTKYDPPKVTFNDALKKIKLNTFGDLTKKMRVNKAAGKEVIIKADRAVFA